MVRSHGAVHGERAQVEHLQAVDFADRIRRQRRGESRSLLGPAEQNDVGLKRAELSRLLDPNSGSGGVPGR
jgi:hypothetical protein